MNKSDTKTKTGDVQATPNDPSSATAGDENASQTKPATLARCSMQRMVRRSGEGIFVFPMNERPTESELHTLEQAYQTMIREGIQNPLVMFDPLARNVVCLDQSNWGQSNHSGCNPIMFRPVRVFSL